MDPYGQWIWILESGAEVPERREAGLTADGTGICLPPTFADALQRAHVFDRVNGACGTMLDWYEEDEIADPATLGFIAGFIDATFQSDIQNAQLGHDVATFILTHARGLKAVVFRT